MEKKRRAGEGGSVPRSALPKERDGGFTLLELILVMGMIFVIAAVVAPRFSDHVPALRVRKTADLLVAWAQKARSDAATSGLRHRLVFDTREKSFWIELEERPFRDPDKFTPLGGSWDEEKIPELVNLEKLEGLETDGVRKFLEFLPDGTTVDATIVVFNDRDDRVTIKVVGATSRVSVEGVPEP